MTEPSCGTCKYFKKIMQAIGQGGTCHRYPPTLIAVPIPSPMQPGQIQLKQMAFYPPVSVKDWCGEYGRKVQPDEN